MVAEAGRTPVSGAEFRSVLGRVPTSVGVVAGTGSDGTPAGLTIGTFTSVSLSPPLIAFCPSGSSTSWPRIRPMGRFCVSLLAADQDDVCAAFASKRPDKFSGWTWDLGHNGAPRLRGSVAWVECDIQHEYDAGDHTLVIGRVTALEAGDGGVPMVFLGGRYLGVG